MGRASSAKKVARAARGTGRPGARRSLVWPATITGVVVLGVALILLTVSKPNEATAAPIIGDHWHAAYGIDNCGTFIPSLVDVTADQLGLHTHGDGLIHIHPFTDSAAGRKAVLGIFLDQVGISMTNETLTLSSGASFTEGTTKCEGGRDGVLQVAKWDHVTDAAKGNKPNQIFTDGFDKIRLGADESFTIAFMPLNSTIPAKPDVAQRVAGVSDLGATTTLPSSSDTSSSNSDTVSSSPPPASGDTGSTTTTVVPGGSSSSGP
jgi:hypothetical protein